MRTSIGLVLIIAAGLFSSAAVGVDSSFIQGLGHVSTVASTVPSNGDVNPYGVAIVPVTMGTLVKNSVLVSNFNNASNLQGTGSTIVQISPGGSLSVFASLSGMALPGSCPGGVGLTTALVALRSGWVIVGSLPTSDGTASTAKAGCLIVLNSSGEPVETLSGDGINGPWDMTAVDMGTSAVLFVSNVLNGTVAADGAVVSQGSVRTDPAALVIGPTGLGMGAGGVLFVADTLQNRIAAIPNAMTRTTDAGSGTTVAQGGALKQPLGLAIAPNGDIITVNGGNGHMVELTASGVQVSAPFVDVSHSKNGSGTLFGLAIAPNASGVYYVDDGNNTLNLLH